MCVVKSVCVIFVSLQGIIFLLVVGNFHKLELTFPIF